MYDSDAYDNEYAVNQVINDQIVNYQVLNQGTSEVTPILTISQEVSGSTNLYVKGSSLGT